MFGSQVLEVAIGLAFLYLFLSVICSAIKEWISGLFALRAQTLDEGLRTLLGDLQGNGLTQQLYQHPLIESLCKHSDKTGKLRKPSYIPAKNFAIALMDTLSAQKTRLDQGVQTLYTSIDHIQNPAIKQALQSLVDDAGDDIQRLRSNVESWFDSAMERAAGWYKRKAQFIILMVALLITVLTNADSMMISKALWQDATLRASLVMLVEEKITEDQLSEQQADALLQVQLQKLDLPIGWTTQASHIDPVPHTFMGWLYKIIGLLVTCIAVSLGAPFWFDALNKLVNLRASGKQPDKPAHD